jgi:hypothetical protein
MVPTLESSEIAGIARLRPLNLLTRREPTAKAIKRSRCVTALYLSERVSPR